MPRMLTRMQRKPENFDARLIGCGSWATSKDQQSSTIKLVDLRAGAKEKKMSDTAVSSGIGLGSAIAVTVSWSLKHSVGWAILHGICGWLYILYALLSDYISL